MLDHIDGVGAVAVEHDGGPVGPVASRLPVHLRPGGEEGLCQQVELIVRNEIGLLDPADQPPGGVAPTPVCEEEHGRGDGAFGLVRVELVEQTPRLEGVSLVATTLGEAEQASTKLASVVRGVERHEIDERRPIVLDIDPCHARAVCLDDAGDGIEGPDQSDFLVEVAPELGVRGVQQAHHPGGGPLDADGVQAVQHEEPTFRQVLGGPSGPLRSGPPCSDTVSSQRRRSR